MQPDEIRPLKDTDRTWIRQMMLEEWGAPFVVTHNAIYYPERLPGFIAAIDQKLAGLLTYHIEEGACEIVTINSLVTHQGVGTRLVEAVCKTALDAECHRLWLCTTNDNLDALRFYQKRGFHMIRVIPNVVVAVREIKPTIPDRGDFDIPIRDEIELELQLGSASCSD